MSECIICHEPLDSTEVTIKCGHKFHYECILLSYKSNKDKYLKTIRTCPYCRKDGGYLHLIDNNIPLEYIHTEYSIFKDALRAGDKEIYMKYLDKTRCLSVLKNGIHKGLQCMCLPQSNSDFCGRHKPKIADV